MDVFSKPNLDAAFYVLKYYCIMQPLYLNYIFSKDRKKTGAYLRFDP